MEPSTNVFTKENFGAPPPAHGKLGLYIPRRGLLSSAYLPSRWQRKKIEGWRLYMLSIPATFPGMFSLAAQDTEQFTANVPVYFALGGFVGTTNNSAGVQVQLFYQEQQQALVNPFGPDLQLSNLAGDGQNTTWLKEFMFMDPGDTLVATIANLAPVSQQGQFVAVGFQPMYLGLEVSQEFPRPGVPFFLNH